MIENGDLEVILELMINLLLFLLFLGVVVVLIMVVATVQLLQAPLLLLMCLRLYFV